MSTLEYLYDFRWMRASSEMHSCTASPIATGVVRIGIVQGRDEYLLLLGVIGVVGVVTGEGRSPSDDEVFTVNSSCGRIVDVCEPECAPTTSEWDVWRSKG